MTRKMTTHMSWQKYADVLGARESFRTGGALRGERLEGPENGLTIGRLPDPWRTQLTTQAIDHIDYVVYSYQTPIAWHDMTRDEWIVPPVKYSPTTTQHQHTVITAVSNIPGN